MFTRTSSRARKLKHRPVADRSAGHALALNDQSERCCSSPPRCAAPRRPGVVPPIGDRLLRRWVPTAVCSSSFGDSEVVAGRIEETEVSQAPRPGLQVGGQRPASPLNAVEFIGKVVDLEHELHSDWRATGLSMPVVLSTRSANPDAIPLNSQVGLRLLSPIRDDAEAEHAGIEVCRGVQVGREDFQWGRERERPTLGITSSSGCCLKGQSTGPAASTPRE